MKIYDSDFGFKYNGVAYDFTDVVNLTIEDPETTKLIRGANSTNLVGLAYKEGTKEAKMLTLTVLNLSADMLNLLNTIYDNQTRIEIYVIDRKTGSSKIGKDAIISKKPMQLSIEDSAESLNIALAFETFNLKDNIKE